MDTLASLIFTLLFLIGIPFLLGYLVDSRKVGLGILSVLPLLIAGIALLMLVAAVSTKDTESASWSVVFAIGGGILAAFLICCALIGYGLGRLARRFRESGRATPALHARGPGFCSSCGLRLLQSELYCPGCGRQVSPGTGEISPASLSATPQSVQATW